MRRKKRRAHAKVPRQGRFFLELVRDFMIERERENFVLDKADFAVVAGSYDEKSNAVSNKICRS